MRVYETSHRAGDCMSAHRHQSAYAALVLDGEYEEICAEGVWRAQAGDVIVHPPFHLHLNRFERSARVMNFELSNAIVRRAGARAYGVFRARDAGSLLGAHADDGAFEKVLASAEPRHPIKPRDWVDQLAAELRLGPARRIQELARGFGVSAEHAARAFRRRFGVTPQAYRAEQRLRMSLVALAEGDAPLGEVAAACGFADQAHCSRVLMAATGRTPKQLRTILS